MLVRRLCLAIAVAAAATVVHGSAPAANPALGAAAKPTVRVTPAAIRRGHTITVSGRRWPRRVTVQLLIGPPRSEADPVGSVRTTSQGTFRRPLKLSARTRPGHYVLLACRRECRVKASARLRITR